MVQRKEEQVGFYCPHVEGKSTVVQSQSHQVIVNLALLLTIDFRSWVLSLFRCSSRSEVLLELSHRLELRLELLLRLGHVGLHGGALRGTRYVSPGTWYVTAVAVNVATSTETSLVITSSTT